MKIKKEIKKIWKIKKEKKKKIELSKIVISMLNNGKIRVCNFKKNKWKINYWIKKAILMYIKNKDKFLIRNLSTNYYDKFLSKFSNIKDIRKNIRISEGAIVRFGSYIGKKSVLMPCFINVGAYVDKNCMIDTWATIGSCAQIGKNVHISGGSGIGGVLEPVQANPVIIEKNCFIGARSEIVEGIIVKKNSVISMGVFLGKSTKIFNRIENKFITNGIIPKNSVVVPGSISYGKYSLYSAIIVKKTDYKTKKKVMLNSLLRDNEN